MLGDQEELKARLSELRRELGGIAKAAAPKIEPERPSPTLAPPSAAPAPKAQQPPVESTATAGKPKPKACWAGQGCGDGPCNEELGRCDCPPFKKGPKCGQPLFSKCVDQWGLKPPVAICGIHSQPAFPASCDCVEQCHEMALDARQECLVERCR